MSKFLVCFGACSALLGVIAGAFGGHYLKLRLATPSLAVYQTAVHYQFWHALGAMLVGVLLIHLPSSKALRCAGALMALGSVLFCGSLYALALTGVGAWGTATPLGGVAWVTAWGLCAYAVLRA
jgi:uncharacterized membrane protein YgdD (TMEM256/DUF423 family)